MASLGWAKRTARRDENIYGFGFGVAYTRCLTVRRNRRCSDGRPHDRLTSLSIKRCQSYLMVVGANGVAAVSSLAPWSTRANLMVVSCPGWVGLCNFRWNCTCAFWPLFYPNNFTIDTKLELFHAGRATSHQLHNWSTGLRRHLSSISLKVLIVS